MSGSVIRGGAGNQIALLPTLSAFPTSTFNGDFALALDTDLLYAFNTGSQTWVSVAASGGSGTVTSVDMTVPSFLSVAGGPITAAGTFAVTLATQTANKVFAGPTSGGAATPTFRSLVAADLPTIAATAGGTGLTTYTTGDILYASATNTLSKLAIGTAGQVLTVASGLPSWAAASGGSTLSPTPAVDLISADGAITLSGEQVIDGVTTNLSRVAVIAQGASGTDPANGIYTSAAGAWARVSDLNTASQFYAGLTFSVLSGDTYHHTSWALQTKGPYTLGTTSLDFQSVAEVPGNDGSGFAIFGPLIPGNQTKLNFKFTNSSGSSKTQTLNFQNASTNNSYIFPPTGGSATLVTTILSQTLTHKDLSDASNTFPASFTNLSSLQGLNNVYLDANNYPTIAAAITQAESLSAANSSPGVCIVIPAGFFNETVTIRKNVSLLGAGVGNTYISNVTIRPTSNSVAPQTICISNLSLNNRSDTGTFTVVNETAASSGVFNTSMLADGTHTGLVRGLVLNNVSVGVTSIKNIGQLTLADVYCDAATFDLFNIANAEITGGFIDSTVTITGNDAATGAQAGDTNIFADVACIIGSIALVKAGGTSNVRLNAVNCELASVDIGTGTELDTSGGSTSGYTTGTPTTWNCTAPYTPATSGDWATQPTNVDSALDKLARLPSARYFASSTSISGTLATISWTTKDYDTDNAMSSGTYTVPVAGKYQINAALLVSGTISLNNTLIMEIQKNGTVVSRTTEFLPGTITDGKVAISDLINCAATDTIRIQVSCSATGPAIVSSNFDNYISLSRVG